MKLYRFCYGSESLKINFSGSLPVPAISKTSLVCSDTIYLNVEIPAVYSMKIIYEVSDCFKISECITLRDSVRSVPTQSSSTHIRTDQRNSGICVMLSNYHCVHRSARHRNTGAHV